MAKKKSLEKYTQQPKNNVTNGGGILLLIFVSKDSLNQLLLASSNLS
jgi:hypothetical protein